MQANHFCIALRVAALRNPPFRNAPANGANFRVASQPVEEVPELRRAKIENAINQFIDVSVRITYKS
jgi:hypothetical protein